MDPFDYHVTNSNQTLEFYAYGAKLSEIEAISCFKKALNDAIFEHRNAETLKLADVITYLSSFKNLDSHPHSTRYHDLENVGQCGHRVFMVASG